MDQGLEPWSSLRAGSFGHLPGHGVAVLGLFPFGQPREEGMSKEYEASYVIEHGDDAYRVNVSKRGGVRKENY